MAKTGLLEGITAVELDNRLVDACIKNIQMNKLEDIIQVAQEDAGAWAKSSQKKKSLGYDIILVDPPRHGLDDQVCRMVLEGSFRHFLYISCGHQALLRDLGKLSSSYEVVDCAQLDLFPRTDSIETLVHLQRRADNDESIL